MNNLLNKSHLPNYFHNQFIPSFLVLIFALLLGNKQYSPLRISISIAILFYYSYFIHRLFHNFPDLINVHKAFHHNTDLNNDTIIATIFCLVIELFVNILFFVIFYFIQKLLNISYVPNMLIFYYAFIYTTVHIINYSIFHISPEHMNHHKTSNNNTSYNYGPDLVDHIFNTNYSDNFENYNHIIPNTLLSFLITYYFYKPNML
jgi:hypothetical protein